MSNKKYTLLQYGFFLITGILFGIVITKAEVVSWFRIFEMFRFQSFHMYGVIGVAVVTGILVVKIIKHFHVKTLNNQPIAFRPKAPSLVRYLFGGIIFGLGWAMSGACPGPMFTLLGNGYLVFLVIIAFALLGTFFYGLVKDKLPH